MSEIQHRHRPPKAGEPNRAGRTAQAASNPVTPTLAEKRAEPPHGVPDVVEISSIGSFPASDPPGWIR